MTYEQIFAGRMVLMRVQRHICQNNKYAVVEIASGILIPEFADSAAGEAFIVVERNLVALENEFQAKRDRCRIAKKRKALDRRADRQVTV